MLGSSSLEYLAALTHEFQLNGDVDIAHAQKQYMRNQFEFYGLKTEIRRRIQKPFLSKEFLPEKAELPEIINTLWIKPQRDFHLFGQELVWKYAKQFQVEDITLLEYMVTHQSWWDTVDFIATKPKAAYFKLYPEEIPICIERWLSSGNIWLQRSALLFQLKYKHDIDKELLSRIIRRLLGSEEFFINKAIGWILREYSRTNPDWVIAFVHNTKLSNLSRREALRLIGK